MKIKIAQPTEDELKTLDVCSWSSWGCGVSVFDWQYSDDEEAYILEGKVIVQTDDGDVEITGGDFVTFPKGMKCTWDVREPIKKVYRFI